MPHDKMKKIRNILCLCGNDKDYRWHCHVVSLNGP